MFILILFTFLVTEAHNGTRNFDECQKANFEPKACWEAKQLHKAGKFGCEISFGELNANGECVK